MGRGISQSAMSVYRDCPYAYKLHYINKKQSIFWDPSILDVGSFVHEAIEKYYNLRFLSKADSYEDILIETYDELKKIWDRSFLPEQLKKAFICLENHAKWEFSNIKSGIRTKPLVEMKIPAEGFYGIIDYVDLQKSIAVDWKTGTHPALYYGYKMQAEVYKTLYESKFKQKLKHFYFFFLHPGEWRTVKFGTEKQDKIKKDMFELRNAINKSWKENYWPKKPRTDKQCKNCQYNLYCQIRGD